MEGKIVYFEKIGWENTEEALSIAKKRAEDLGIRTILVASTRGDTAARAVEVFKGAKVVAVSHATGWREPNVQVFTEENRKMVESKGGVVLTTKHAFGGFTRARHHYHDSEAPRQPVYQPPAVNETGAIVANTLRMFGAGMKVVCEIALMAADAGLVRTDEDVIVIAGSGRGADTAVVLRPANSVDLFNLRVKEILCKPHLTVTRQRQEVAAAEHHHH